MGTPQTLQALKDAQWRRHLALQGERKRHRSPNGAQAIVLAVARKFPGPFGDTALILACWRKAPQVFGLRGCEELHPDSRRVWNALYATNGLASPKRNLIRRRSDGLLEVVQ